VKFGSLFSGIGGFDLGFEQAGLVCEWQVEIDKDCARVLENRFPNVSRFADVKDVGKLPTVDVICGGFPCQDLSVAGKRAGLAGERSGLWFEFLRIIESNLPRWIVIENVPGLLSSDEGRDFAAILRGLVNVGYCLAWRVLDAQYAGVAQRRRRVFIVGSLGDGSCAQILFESESVSWNPPTRGEAGARVANAISGGAHPGGHNGQDDMMVIPIQEVGARESKNQNGVGIGIGKDSDVMYTLQSGQVHGVAHALRSEGADASEDGTDRGTPLVPVILRDERGRCNDGRTSDKAFPLHAAKGQSEQQIVAFSSKDHGADAGQISPTLRAQNFKDSHINGGGQVAIAFQQDATDKFSVDVTPTMRGKSNGGTRAYGVAGGFGVRRLTPRECERLQGFPDDWTLYDAAGKEISDSARYRMLGNAVAVPVAKWVGKRLVEFA
jgi:DNA (cytosine-5)-methyltransferase 1